MRAHPAPPLLAACAFWLLLGPGCTPLLQHVADPTVDLVQRSHDRTMIAGRVHYRCLVPRRAGSGVKVQFLAEDGRELARTETGTDGSFVLASPEGLSPDAEVYLAAGDLRSDKLPVLFDGHYTAVINIACPESGDPVWSGRVGTMPIETPRPSDERRSAQATPAQATAGPLDLGLPAPDARPVPR